eukprot:614964-Rhodomonas_salina.2
MYPGKQKHCSGSVLPVPDVVAFPGQGAHWKLPARAPDETSTSAHPDTASKKPRADTVSKE